jgi:hypothetical protein
MNEPTKKRMGRPINEAERGAWLAAVKAGHVRYESTRPCPINPAHGRARYVINQSCCDCVKERTLRYQRNRAAKAAQKEAA